MRYHFVYLCDNVPVLRVYSPSPLLREWLRKSNFNRLLPRNGTPLLLKYVTPVYELSDEVRARLISHCQLATWHDVRIRSSQLELLARLRDTKYTYLGFME